MVQCLLLLVYQSLPVQAGQPPIQRVFRKHETDRYAVDIDSESQSGKAHYEFELKMFAERPVALSSDTKVSATFLNLHSSFDGMKAPDRKIFGSASYQFPAAGFPFDYSLAGNENIFVLPLLSWYLPLTSPVAGIDFDVPEMIFDNTIHVSGVGSVRKINGDSTMVKLNLAFKFSGSIQASTAPAFTSTATFNANTGLLLKSEGDMKSLAGTMTFHVKKI